METVLITDYQNAAINVMRLGRQSLGWKTLDAPDWSRGSSHLFCGKDSTL